MEDPQLLSKLGNAVGLAIPQQFSITHHDDTLHEEVAGVEDEDGSRLLNAASVGDLEVYLPTVLCPGCWLFNLIYAGCNVSKNPFSEYPFWLKPMTLMLFLFLITYIIR